MHGNAHPLPHTSAGLPLARDPDTLLKPCGFARVLCNDDHEESKLMRDGARPDALLYRVSHIVLDADRPC